MAKASTKKKKTAAPAAPGERLIPPPGGATVRMYRIGHGDCFLIAFAGDAADDPAYVLIDCGYKPGSPGMINPPTSAKEIAADIRTATGGRIDVAIITHEHQDHVNGITDAHFQDIEIGEAWFAWTENPGDDLANELRKKFKDKLLGLLAARNRLAAAGGDDKRVETIDELLAFELGGEDERFNVAAAVAMLGAAETSSNKKSMKIVKDKAQNGITFLKPHEKIYKVPGAPGVRVFPLGPPRDPDLLESLDPTGAEEFHGPAFAATSSGSHFAAAARAAEDNTQRVDAPFANRYAVPWAQAFAGSDHSAFFNGYYGKNAAAPAPPEATEAVPNAEWRRIDKDWLYAADQLALDMNDQTNNASLVLAFELGKGGKVLLFAADAQRGNWISWSKNSFKDGHKKVTARDLLSRTVLYKVGHHGSHNATINGQPTDDYTNLAWMAEGEYAREFCAMITAVRAWAETQKGWDHPLKAIKDALLKKAGGRVFQTDTDFDQMKMPAGSSQVDWDAFSGRTTPHRLYFDYQIEP